MAVCSLEMVLHWLKSKQTASLCYALQVLVISFRSDQLLGKLADTELYIFNYKMVLFYNEENVSLLKTLDPSMNSFASVKWQ